MVLCQSALHLKKTETEELQRAATISAQGVFSYLEAFMYFFFFLFVCKVGLFAGSLEQGKSLFLWILNLHVQNEGVENFAQREMSSTYLNGMLTAPCEVACYDPLMIVLVTSNVSLEIHYDLECLLCTPQPNIGCFIDENSFNTELILVREALPSYVLVFQSVQPFSTDFVCICCHSLICILCHLH